MRRHRLAETDQTVTVVPPIIQENNMLESASKFGIAIAAIAVIASVSLAPVTALAQDAASGVAASSAGTTKAQAKAQRKAARKQARAKRNAELKKLEDAGYNPATRDDENYPQDVQNAEKKAAKAGAASQ
jgi:type IV secretory pathway VirB6-like protein